MSWQLSAFADEAGPTIDEQIRALQKAAFKWIDLRNVDGHNITVLPLDLARSVRQKLDAAGIQVCMYGSPLGKIDITEDFAIDVQKLRHLATLRPILGASMVRIFSYYNKTQRPREEFQREAFRRLRELKKLAGELGLMLYHENEKDIYGEKCADVLEIARAFRGENFRMIFDFGNYNAAREDAWANWQVLRDTTDAIHLKDNAWNAEGKLAHVPVGQGQGSVPGILKDATSRGWRGPLVVEPHLQHSAAVMATGPTGIPNQAYTKMSAAESFHVACAAASELVAKL